MSEAPSQVPTDPKVGMLRRQMVERSFSMKSGNSAISSQAKLLRALQEKEIRPVGSTQQIQINARVIAATNRDLETEVREGTFRQDLYFRLNVMQIKLPALRDHKIDIPQLASYFLNKFSDPLHPVREISVGAMGQLMAYSWPGNIRELENSIESAVALSSHAILRVGDLPAKLQDREVHLGPRKQGTLEDKRNREDRYLTSFGGNR